jgi:hypothetical protein
VPAHQYYDRQVFINCPFDDDYRPLFQALVFTTYAAGLRPRCALEVSDASEVRLEKILRIIDECRFGIHDVSRTELDAASQLPRFNMPLELGLFLGCKRFGTAHHKRKSCLVLDRDRYRYQKYISDIAGQDPEAHGNSPEQVIRCVRDWLRTETKDADIPGSGHFVSRFQLFQTGHQEICQRLHLNPGQLTYPDFTHVVTSWLTESS